MALFDNIGAFRNNPKNLLEFRAGKMYMRNKMVYPDKRKGLAYIHQSDDGLMHFCWKDRTTGIVEDDLIIFPEDFEYKHLSQCTTGRVYALRFKSNSRKFILWLQEPKTDKDEENCKKVIEFLTHPPVPGSVRGGANSGLPGDMTDLRENDLQNLLSSMNHQQLAQLLGGMALGTGGSSAGLLSSLLGQQILGQAASSNMTAAAQVSAARGVSSDTAASHPIGGATGNNGATAGNNSKVNGSNIRLSDLQNILSSMNVVPASSSAPNQGAVDLAKALNPEEMIPILANSEVQARLLPFLPPGESLPKTEQELRNILHSPQFQQALTSFSSALESGNLGSLMSQFGLGEEAVIAANQGDLEAFVKAMQEAAKKKKPRREDDDDNSMEH